MDTRERRRYFTISQLDVHSAVTTAEPTSSARSSVVSTKRHTHLLHISTTHRYRNNCEPLRGWETRRKYVIRYTGKEWSIANTQYYTDSSAAQSGQCSIQRERERVSTSFFFPAASLKLHSDVRVGWSTCSRSERGRENRTLSHECVYGSLVELPVVNLHFVAANGKNNSRTKLRNYIAYLCTETKKKKSKKYNRVS